MEPSCGATYNGAPGPGTSKTGMARWHAASTDQNRSIIHAANDRSDVQLHDGVDRRKRNQQGEAQSD
eukprot:2909473-Amphidinium_carterae.1